MGEPLSVFIMGAGRMGGAVATVMSRANRVAVYDLDEEKARRVAERVGGQFMRPDAGVPWSDAVLLVLPAETTVAGLKSVLPFLSPESVVINVATSSMKEELRPVLGGLGNLTAAKVIGHYSELASRPVVLVDADTKRGGEVAMQLFSGLGDAQPGDEHMVQMINATASREVLGAGLRIEEALKGKGVPPTWIASAVRVVGPGTLKAYANKDMGPWGLKVLADLKESMNRA